jgi:ArsR family transcriptional regulator
MPRKFPECEVTVIHQDKVNEVSQKMPPEEALVDLSELYKAFSDSTRVRLLCALTLSEMCVCDLAALLSMSSTAISHQLRLLKQARLIRSRREGKVVYYALCDNHVETILAQGWAHIKEMEGGHHHE